ncbi:hypothetical protein Leryth_012314 [Lithospermum erythrorhizon]|nr:hypothetical protein Leryth_012314 [Lithospermum erythrorhizon]
MIQLNPTIQTQTTNINYFLAEHPLIVNFRWNSTHTWGATWSFLISSISIYILSSTTLHLLLLLFRRRRPIPLGPIPALHSLFMAIASTAVFAGILSSSIAEIRDTRWFWQRSKTPFEWLFCFPIGTRPSGRVFFWSYIFYLTRFLHIFRTYLIILQHRKLSIFQIFNHSILILVSFVWLEFSQSLQVIQILVMTLALAIVYGHRFWREIGSRKARFPSLMNFQFSLLICNLICHGGVLLLHYLKGGCNGMGAWVFNTSVNGMVLLFFFKLYLQKFHTSRKKEAIE